MTRWRKRFLWGFAGGVLAVFVILAFRPSPVLVEIAKVTRGPIQITVNAEGRTRVRERYVVSAPVMGRLGRIELSEGDVVRPGTLLTVLIPAPLDTRSISQNQAALQAAEAEGRAASAQVEQARATLDQAQRERQRYEKLSETGVIAPKVRDDAVTAEAVAAKALEAAQFSASAARYRVETARSALLSATADTGAGAQAIRLRSPTAGRILRVLQESERVVTAGTPLIEIGDPAAIELVFDVLSSDAVKIAPGASILVENSGMETVLQGHVQTVEPSAFTKTSALGIEEQRVNIIGKLDESSAVLGDGYRIDGRIVVWSAPGVLKVPITALFRTSDSWTVFLVRGQHAVLQQVQIGHRNENEAEALSGVTEGDAVVRYPNDSLRDGSAVKTHS
jgi:HlyD family secretion protein